MPFRRFFDRGAKRENPVSDDAAPADETEQLVEEDEQGEDEEPDGGDEWVGDDTAPEEASDIDWRARAIAVLPTGASTGSKRSEALYGSADANGPLSR
jgi:hypothetical protein